MIDILHFFAKVQFQGVGLVVIARTLFFANSTKNKSFYQAKEANQAMIIFLQHFDICQIKTYKPEHQ